MDGLWILFYVTVNVAVYLLVIKFIVTVRQLFKRVEALEKKMANVNSEGGK